MYLHHHYEHELSGITCKNAQEVFLILLCTHKIMMMMMQQPVRVKTINTFECGYAMWYLSYQCISMLAIP